MFITLTKTISNLLISMDGFLKIKLGESDYFFNP